MSLPICAKMPVTGAMNPMRSSSAFAFEAMPNPAANTLPSNSGITFSDSFLVMVVLPEFMFSPPDQDGADASVFVSPDLLGVLLEALRPC